MWWPWTPGAVTISRDERVSRARATDVITVGRSGCFWNKTHHGGEEAGRSPSMRRRISTNRVLSVSS